MRRMGEVAGARMWADLEFREIMEVASQDSVCGTAGGAGFGQWWTEKSTSLAMWMTRLLLRFACSAGSKVLYLHGLQPGNEALFEAEVLSRSRCAAALYVPIFHGCELQQQCCSFWLIWNVQPYMHFACCRDSLPPYENYQSFQALKVFIMLEALTCLVD